MIFAEIDKHSTALPFVLKTLCDHSRQNPISRPNGNSFHQFLWVTQGEGFFEIAGQRLLLSEGNGIFTRAMVPHAYGGDEFYTAWCTFLLPEQTLDYIGVGEYLPFRVPTNLPLETKQLLHFANGNSTPWSRSAAGYSYVTELFTAILSSKESKAVRVRRLLEQRYAEPLTLLEIAEYLNTDRFLLCHLYKQEYGITMMDDLNRIRIQKAKKFLKSSSEPIETVGKLCGFDSPSYFGKRFRETVGCTPTDYRKKHL
ncbi:MAG: helix-turn-helix transcriptional regulator [Clostridia bacterium]|nr:helix-turn-helix transcriptional regulator [Clostridia bacterium]